MKTTKAVKQYILQPDYSAPRATEQDEQYQMSIVDKWEFDLSLLELDGISGNMKYATVFRINEFSTPLNPKVSFVPMDEYPIDWHKKGYLPFSRVISAPLLMYQLVCMFGESPATKYTDFYKVIFQYPLRHKETGKELIFGDFKASSAFWMREIDPKKLDKTFKADLAELLEFMASGKVQHPYDGTIAGSVA